MDSERSDRMILMLAVLGAMVRRLEHLKAVVRYLDLIEAYVWDTEPEILGNVPDHQPQAEDLNLTK